MKSYTKDDVLVHPFSDCSNQNFHHKKSHVWSCKMVNECILSLVNLLVGERPIFRLFLFFFVSPYLTTLSPFAASPDQADNVAPLLLQPCLFFPTICVGGCL